MTQATNDPLFNRIMANVEERAKHRRERLMADTVADFKEQLDEALKPDRSMAERIADSEPTRRHPALSAMRVIPGWDREHQDLSRSWPKEQRGTPEVYREAFEWTRAMIAGDYSTVLRLSEPHQRDLGTGTPSAGGYLMPTGMANMIAQIEVQAAKLATLCSGFPVGDGHGKVLTVPKEVSQQVIVFTTEGAAPSGDTEPVLGQVTLTAKKIGCVVLVSNELLADSPIATVNMLIRQCATQMAHMKDELILTSTAAGGSGGTTFTGGVEEDAGAVTEATSTVVGYADVVKLVHALTSPYHQGAVVCAPSAVYQLLLNIRATGGSPIFEGLINAPTMIGDVEGGFPNVLGKRALILDQMTAGGLLIGNFKHYALMERGGIRAETSRDSNFGTDQTSFRFFWRGDGDVLQAAAFKLMAGLTTAGT